MKLAKILLLLSSISAAAAVTAVGCSSDSGGDPGGSGAGGPGGTGPGGAGGGLGFDAGTGDGSIDEDAACVEQTAQADYKQRPIDVIMVIDNSASMTEEITSVQQNIAANFTEILGQSQIDYRVILISDYGDATVDQSVCISTPLGSADCAPPPNLPTHNPPLFYHYSLPVSSFNGLCRLVDTYNGVLGDEYGLAPQGWKEWLRPDALKAFVVMTDDKVECSPIGFQQNVDLDDLDTEEGGLALATLFDQKLRELDPVQFGTEEERNYVFFSFVGVRANTPATAPWPPENPMVMLRCPTGVRAGTGYQALSMLTGGYRFPICSFDLYDGAFQEIANSVISGAKLACEISVPDPPEGENINLNTVRVKFTPSSGDPEFFSQVPSAAECTPTSFYIEAGAIQLCPAVCDLVQADNAAQIQILYGCTQTTN